MIAPHELKNKAFNKAVRGYNCAEVDEYIEFLLEQYTELYKENADLKNELHTTKVKYSELHSDEDAIRAVIVRAQKLGETIVQQAKNEAASIIEGAKSKCQSTIDETEKVISDRKLEIEHLKEIAEKYRKQLYEQYIEHINMLQSMDFSLPDSATADTVRADVNKKVDSDTESAKKKISSLSSSEE